MSHETNMKNLGKPPQGASVKHRRVALVDADVVAFKCAAVADSNGYDENEAGLLAIESYQKWVRGCFADDSIACFTGHDNFRKKVSESYKADRKDKPKPKHLEACKIALRMNYPWALEDELEADDLLGILSNQITDVTPIIVTIDKDLLQVSGWHYDPDKSAFPFYVTVDQANAWHAIQLIAGDSTDGIKGIPGMGVAKAIDALIHATVEDDDPITMTQAEMVYFDKELCCEYEETLKLITIKTEHGKPITIRQPIAAAESDIPW